MDEAELREREAKLIDRERVLAARIVRVELGEQLREAGCRPEAITDAAALMSTTAQVELAEDGMSVEKVSLAGAEATGVATAARAFLKARPFLQAPTDPGKPKPTTPAPLDLGNAWTAPTPAVKPKPDAPTPLGENASAHDLMAAGWAQAPE